MKHATKIVRILAVILLVLVLAFVIGVAVIGTIAPVASARGLAATGATPIYDSGWVLTGTTQTFTHNLGEKPTLWTLLVADNDDGNYATAAAARDKTSTGNYGVLIKGVSCMTFTVGWQAAGIGYEATQGWYQRGTDYTRLLIYASQVLRPGYDECVPNRP